MTAVDGDKRARGLLIAVARRERAPLESLTLQVGAEQRRSPIGTFHFFCSSIVALICKISANNSTFITTTSGDDAA